MDVVNFLLLLLLHQDESVTMSGSCRPQVPYKRVAGRVPRERPPSTTQEREREREREIQVHSATRTPWNSRDAAAGLRQFKLKLEPFEFQI